MGFVSYGGQSGGLRAVQMSKLIVTALRMMPVPEAVAVPFFNQHFDEAGVFRGTESMAKAAARDARRAAALGPRAGAAAPAAAGRAPATTTPPTERPFSVIGPGAGGERAAAAAGTAVPAARQPAH